MSDASPSTSARPMQVTVADESEELKAEATGIDVKPTESNGNAPKDEDVKGGNINGDVNGDVEMKTETNGDGEAKPDDDEGDKPEVEVEDPNKLPDDACETLYIQNLNEKVRLPGQFKPSLPP